MFSEKDEKEIPRSTKREYLWGLVIDAGGCVRDGVIFRQPRNKVILTEGQAGAIPAECIRSIVRLGDASSLYIRDMGRSGFPLTRQLGLTPAEVERQPPVASRMRVIAVRTANRIDEKDDVIAYAKMVELLRNRRRNFATRIIYCVDGSSTSHSGRVK